jgi:spore germination cell wall hydrolase CwlJ-like protein
MATRTINRDADEKDILIATLYAEARGEKYDEGLEWVVWVIRNRAKLGKSYWGGKEIKNVCLHKQQFECWNNKNEIKINEEGSFQRCKRIVEEVLAKRNEDDPTNGCDHYINPDKCNPSWIKNLDEIKKIGNHQFYRSK